MQRSRGTGPRATKKKRISAFTNKKPTKYRRARACPSPCNDRGGQAPALRLSRPSPCIVGLGPSDATRASERVPLAMQRSRGTGTRATVTETIARDRPSRYGNRDALGGQAPALRGKHRTSTSPQRPLPNVMPRARDRKRNSLTLDIYEQRRAIR